MTLEPLIEVSRYIMENDDASRSKNYFLDSKYENIKKQRKMYILKKV